MMEDIRNCKDYSISNPLISENVMKTKYLDCSFSLRITQCYVLVDTFCLHMG